MLGIEFRFPARRYHATPWGSHVNEGRVEWPPSPWRILRALIATRHLKARHEVTEDDLTRLVERLAGELPQYGLPPAVMAHTRHYMPRYREKTTKVFDAFVDVQAGCPLVVRWPNVDLDDDERGTLALLLERLSYLGRAESWVEANVVDDPQTLKPNAVPMGGTTPPSCTVVRLLASLDPSGYRAWRGAAHDSELNTVLEAKRAKAEARGKDPSKEKLSKKDREGAEQKLPEHLIDAICVDTTDLQRHGWNRPPGSQWVSYAIPSDALSPPARTKTRGRRRTLPTVARFAIASQVRPHLREAVSIAERVRTALNSRSNAAFVFSGKGGQGGVSADGHQHAFFLPEANDPRSPRITHLTIYAAMGFDEEARHSLGGLAKVWGRGGHDLQLVLIGLGSPEDFGGGSIVDGECPVLARSSTWVSRTPFVATRHPKTTARGPVVDERGVQIGSPEHDLRRLLQLSGFPNPRSVTSLPMLRLGGRDARWLDFRIERSRGGGAKAANKGSGFRLEFDEPVCGPLAVGYAAHFGLGQFVPEGVF